MDITKERKPKFQTPRNCDSDACVGVARLSNGSIATKNTGDNQHLLKFTRAEWVAFIHAIKVGEFDSNI